MIHKTTPSLFSTLDALEKTIHDSSPMTDARYLSLHKQIDILLASVEQQPLTHPLKERIIDLCGQLEDRKEQDELQAIKQTAEKLALLVNRYNENHLSARKDRPVLDHASHLLKAANAQIQHDLSEGIDKDSLSEEEIFTLLDIGRCVYNNDLAGARKLYVDLPREIQNQLTHQMKNLLATLFLDKKETLQAIAILTKAMNPSSRDEIDLFYLGIPKSESLSSKSESPSSSKSESLSLRSESPSSSTKIIAFDGKSEKSASCGFRKENLPVYATDPCAF